MPSNTAKGWEDQLSWDDSTSTDGGSSSITIAPEEPVQLIRDPETNQVTKVVYGNMSRMMEGEPVVMWSEEILRDEETGQVIGIRTIRPNGTSTVETILRDENGMFLGTELKYE